MTNRVFLFLGGDSYPADLHVEDALCERLTSSRDHFYRQSDFYGQDSNLAMRKAALRKASSCFPGRQVIAIGRSSGGRIATEAAAEGAAFSAIVVLGYPFRVPDCDEDPARTRHLSAIVTPTLILQGTADPYGSRSKAISTYRLSPAIRTIDLATDHEFHIKAMQWNVVASLIKRHCEDRNVVL